MPKISQYEAPEGLGLRPTETGISAVAAAARRVQGEYNEAAAAQIGTGNRFESAIKGAGDVAVKYLDHQQISKGAPALAGLMAAKTKQWEDIQKTADPNDPTVAVKFREGLEKDLEEFKSGFWTENSQKWAESHVDQYRQHMFVKTAADMANNAKAATSANVRKLENNLSVDLQSDPSETNLRQKLGFLDGSIGALVDSSPNLTGTAAHKIELTQAAKERLVKAAAVSYIEKNAEVPPWVQKKEYKDYLNGPELTMFAKAAKSQQKQDFLIQKQMEQYQLQTTTRAGKDTLAKAFTDNVSFDENGTPTINPSILKQSVDAAKKFTDKDGNPIEEVVSHTRAQINWVQSQLREKREIIVNNNAIQSKLYDGLFSTTNPTSEVDILNANANPDPTKRIDDHTTRTLLNLHKALEEKPLKGPLYQSSLDAVKERLGVNVVGDGHARYNNFMGQFINQYLALPEKDRVGALDINNPESLVSKLTDPLKPTQQQLIMGKYLNNIGVRSDMSPEAIKALQDQMSGAGVPPTQDKLPTIPEPSKRVTGRLYQTPAGPRIWSGTGWRKPE